MLTIPSPGSNCRLVVSSEANVAYGVYLVRKAVRLAKEGAGTAAVQAAVLAAARLLAKVGDVGEIHTVLRLMNKDMIIEHRLARLPEVCDLFLRVRKWRKDLSEQEWRAGASARAARYGRRR